MKTERLELPYRRTGYGGCTRCCVLSESGERLRSVYRYRSRTGNHGGDVYEILRSRKYFVIEYNRSNSGRETLRVAEVSVEEGRESWNTLEPEEYPEVVKTFLDERHRRWRYLPRW